jgi:hypothetical protein
VIGLLLFGDVGLIGAGFGTIECFTRVSIKKVRQGLNLLFLANALTLN